MKFAVVGLMVAAGVLGGCGQHRLAGVVVSGPTGGVKVVDEGAVVVGDAVGGAQVEVMLDPRSMNRRSLGVLVTDGAGRFEVDAGAFDEVSRWLDVEAGLRVSAAGLSTYSARLVVPRGDRLVVITLTDPDHPGADLPDEDLYSEMLRERERFERR
ncbi:MAG: hypothetical protein RLN76_13895 [Phycisphaeraceae bacterium]